MRVTRRTSKNIVTIWPNTGKDGWGETTYGTPYTVLATFEKSPTRGSFLNEQGQNYTPRSVYWYEKPDGIDKPDVNDYIALGDLTANATPDGVQGAEQVRVSKLEDNSVLRGQSFDIMVTT